MRRDDIRVGELHELHRDLRRFRVGFRPWRELLRPEDRALGRALHAELGIFARACGKVRDIDVARTQVDYWVAQKAPGAGSLAEWRARLSARARRGRELLARVARVLVREGRIRGLKFLLERILPSHLQTRWAKRFARTAAELRDQIRTALQRTRARPTVVNFHRLRKYVRGMRILRDSGVFEGSTAYPARTRRLLLSIGKLHDLELLLARNLADNGSRRLQRWKRERWRERDGRLRELSSILTEPALEGELSRLEVGVRV
ncbi:MAG: hypothetical protein L3K13_02270 [Thermoplasmata archaeon]|nr:hypothetical protein [Thermoplasmata archaeon]